MTIWMRAGALCASLFLAIGAVADTFDAARHAALEAAVAKLSLNLETADVDAVVEGMPDKVILAMAEMHNVTDEQLRRVMRSGLRQTLDETGDFEFDILLDAASYGVTPIGRDFAIIPSNGVWHGLGVRTFGHTLAFYDAGAWQLIRVSSPAHYEALAKAYPDLGDVKIPPMQIENLE